MGKCEPTTPAAARRDSTGFRAPAAMWKVRSAWAGELRAALARRPHPTACGASAVARGYFCGSGDGGVSVAGGAAGFSPSVDGFSDFCFVSGTGLPSIT